ncbi:MAG: DUF2225 domain-containing protein [Oscillospiraceae bacterium]|jgi:uncharacterized protein (DUF2225 family)/CRP-like cAMP-binding protein|nr:DUF2225 domain-containing protein [Oscillospiraceae bacterium]
MENTGSLDVKRFPFGSIIVSDSSPKEMIVILQGEVGVYKNYKMADEVFVQSLGQGSFYCEHSLFLNEEHDETLVALTDVFALAVSRNNVRDFFVKYPDAAFSIAETIYHRLADVTVKLNRLQPKEASGNELSRKSTLFPEGHGEYILPLNHNETDIISLTKVACPLCGRKFDSNWVLASKLRRQGTDPDMRVRYKDVEPLYYSIVTCPNCLFSAETTTFPEASKKQADAVAQKTAPYRLDTAIKTGSERDTFTVFAGFYLALLCAPAVQESHELTTAGLWLKISRLYEDCGDKKMHMYAVKQAFDTYTYIYTNLRINDKQTQQVSYLLGELNFKMGDFDAARRFFFNLKADKDTPSSMRNQVDIRLETIREIKNQSPP